MRRSPQHRVADDRCGGERLRFDKWLYDSRENGNSGEWAGFGDACLRWHEWHCWMYQEQCNELLI